MTYNEEVRAKENVIFTLDACGTLCEVVEVDGVLLLYADGYCMGELFEEETTEGYASQIKEILE